MIKDILILILTLFAIIAALAIIAVVEFFQLIAIIATGISGAALKVQFFIANKMKNLNA
ncbi:MAG: hypothetical protein KBB58_12635 [Ferruginibacter sp.]|nr:hypothetical protein [Ferruginibacter sp.]